MVNIQYPKITFPAVLSSPVRLEADRGKVLLIGYKHLTRPG